MKHYLLLIISWLITSSSQAGNSRLYHVDDKMSSSMIVCVTQDTYGWMWIGTENGLNKFDGYRFTKFYYERNDTTTIPDNEICCFLVDKENKLWIGTSKGLARYVYEENQFKRYAFPNGLTPRVESIIQNAEGDILLGTAGHGLYAIKAKTEKMIKLKYFHRQSNDGFASRIFIDARQQLWRSSHHSVINRSIVKKLRPISTHDYPLNYGPAICPVAMNRQGFLLVCMYGILRYDYTTDSFSNADYDLSALGAQVSMRDALMDSQGNLYIGTSGHGLMMIPRGSRTLKQVESQNHAFDLTTANVNKIFEDKDHNLWISCYKKGLLEMNQTKNAFSTWSFSEQDYKLGSSVSSIAPDGEGGIWCTVQKSGVYHINHHGKVISKQPAPDGANTIYRDQQGKYWLGTENALYSYQPITGTSKKILTLDGWGINTISDDGSGNLFVSNFGKGFLIYNIGTRETRSYNMYQADAKKGALCNDWAKSFCMDSKGLLWIGCSDGISCINPTNGNFRVFGWNTLLRGLQCYTIVEMNNGNLLFGTSSGLYLFNRKQNRVSLFPHSEQIANKPIYAIAIDKTNDIWLSTSMEIWQYNSKKRHFIGYLNGNGLHSNEYVTNAMIQTNDDKIIFGTNDGATVFYPHDVKKKNIKLGEVHLTSFIINGKSVYPLQKSFTIPADENTFTMEFSLLNFRNTENIVFQYRINGSGEWLSTDENSNSITFSKIQSGKYLFEIRAMSNGVISNSTLTIPVRVKAPWYASTTAYLAYFILLIGSLLLFFWLLDRQRKRELEKEKIRFLLNMKKDVDKALKNINVKGNNDELMARIMQSINAHLSDPDFNVERLTTDVGISRAQLHRKMKEMTGISTADFIRNLRLEQAARIIKEGKINVTQVAYSVGFNNQSHFSTVFKKHFGMTPSEYATKNTRGRLPKNSPISKNKQM